MARRKLTDVSHPDPRLTDEYWLEFGDDPQPPMRLKILYVTFGEVSRSGPGSFNVASVCDRLGITYPMVNHYFGGRDGLLAEGAFMIYEGYVKRLWDAVLAAPRDPGTIQMFDRIDPYFGDCLRVMDQLGHLDLDSKQGKAPGGYNYPLYEIGVPFIFMNAVGSQRDLETMVHEGGHAIHSFLSRDLSLTAFKNLPSEVAELASMSMELLSMPQWSEFYEPQAQQRAMREQIEGTLKVLPWIAQIDAFQHWIYENPTHTRQERSAHWIQLTQDFGTGLVDWTDYEDLIECSWQRQLHLFEVPFYYIEYGIAQLGALGVWKNSLANKQRAIEQYKNALSLGYSAPMSTIYETAGVPFDFSSERLQTLAQFIKEQLEIMN